MFLAVADLCHSLILKSMCRRKRRQEKEEEEERERRRSKGGKEIRKGRRREREKTPFVTRVRCVS